MKRKALMVILSCFLVFTLVNVVCANVEASLELTINGIGVGNETLPVETKLNVTGSYEDLDGDLSASAEMKVYYKVNSGDSYIYVTTLYSGTVADGGQITYENYELTDVGYYQFRWEVENAADDYAEVRVSTGPVVSEPATLAVLSISLVAIGFVMYVKRPQISTKI